MPPVVEQQSTGDPPGQQAHKRRARRVRKIDFEQLDGLSARTDAELRDTEDALLAFIESEEKRDRLYTKSKQELEQKYQFGRIDGAS